MGVKEQLQEMMEFATYADENEITEVSMGEVTNIEAGDITDVRDLQEAGYLTNDAGFVVTMFDGRKIMVKVTEI